ncbi:alpha/beta hydrolase [Mucilaginibacter sp. OK098]|uniref:alpha/beta hydrolase n=1 Tax=Mucilaginibacter sp. OK098 TaxID=1855297 RepID=UPI00091C27AC|nr:alpha/beta hydrolase [Mucilaginibacter sp. OK098]SHN21336.1 Acetyl esterase/lipase [Mucilaginibacter sp. OK098]
MTTKMEQQMPVKPSKQVEEVGKWWLTMVAAATGHKTLDEARDFGENWAGLTAEPGGVDYIEIDAGGVPAMWAVPKGCIEDRVILCLHGGGFFSGSMYTHRKLYGHFAKAIGCRALILNYHLTPEHVHPAQVNDVFAAYKWLLDQGIQANHIAITGDSAGGGLSITGTLLIRDKGLPVPAAIMPFSAWFDMEVTGGSMDANHGKDLLLNKEWVKGMAGMFLGENGDAKDPHANPLYADLAGLPPVYIQVGGDEVLLDDNLRLAEHARMAGVDVSLDVFPGMQHSFQMAAGRAPESDDSIARFVGWVKPKLGLT